VGEVGRRIPICAAADMALWTVTTLLLSFAAPTVHRSLTHRTAPRALISASVSTAPSASGTPADDGKTGKDRRDRLANQAKGRAVLSSPSPIGQRSAPKPPSAKSRWEVHKFGGASLGTAELYKTCGDLLVDESRRLFDEEGAATPTMAVVSAKEGVTDKLIAVIESAKDDMETASTLLRRIADEQVEVVHTLAGAEAALRVEKRIRSDEEDILSVVRALTLLRSVPPSTVDLVTGYGEVWSAMTMHAYLEGRGVVSHWLDAREVLVVEQARAPPPPHRHPTPSYATISHLGAAQAPAARRAQQKTISSARCSPLTAHSSTSLCEPPCVRLADELWTRD
jgi:hypothetical protein